MDILRTFRIAALSGALAAAAFAQEPRELLADDVLLLLRAGVDSPSVLATLDRRGGPELISEDEVREAEALGASAELLRRLERGLEPLRRLARLATGYEVQRLPEDGVAILVPRGWALSPERNDGRFVAMLRPSDAAAGWFAAPEIFLWIERRTSFPESAGAEMARRLAHTLERRLRAQGMEPRELAGGQGILGTAPAAQHELAATEPRRAFEGRLAMRTRILPDGTVVTLGYSCGADVAAAIRTRFDEIAASLQIDEPAAR